ncbi:ribonuclease H-like domain-containing protein, partial [Tanacetum coccineum]
YASQSPNKNGSEQVGDEVMKEIPASYANKLSPTSLTKANLREVDATVPNDANYYVWLPLASVHEEKYGLKKVTLVKGIFFYKFSSTEGVDSVLRDGPWMILGVLIFLNKWSPSVSLPKEDLSRVPVWEKFHDVPLVAYNSDGLILIATKIGKGGSSGADDKGFVEVKKKKSFVANQKKTPSVGKKNVSKESFDIR